MDKRIISFFIIIIFLFTTFNVIGMKEDLKRYTNINLLTPSPDDEEDQFQKIDDHNLVYISDIQMVSQSFVPAKKYLSRVELKLFQGVYSSNSDLIVSIRDEVDGSDLTYIKVKSVDIPTSENFSSFWVEFDFSDISVTIGDEYYIVSRIAYNDLFFGYAWATCMNSDTVDNYPNGSMWSNVLDENYGWIISLNDTCFTTYGYDDPYAFPDLECDGSLLWEDVTPGHMLTGNFHILNIGVPNSNLDWEIVEYPDWGEWTFTPGEGYGIVGGEEIEVIVTVVAPDDEDSYFSGLIKIINKNNHYDRDVITVTISTSKIRDNSLFFMKELIQFFHNMKSYIIF